jgi:hypothetical protein
VRFHLWDWKLVVEGSEGGSVQEPIPAGRRVAVESCKIAPDFIAVGVRGLILTALYQGGKEEE